MPADLLRGIDSLVLRGIGKFQSRNEFIVEACRAILDEYLYPDAEGHEKQSIPGPSPADRQIVTSRGSGPQKVASRSALIADLPFAAAPLRFATKFVVAQSSPDVTIVDAPLLGLHSRDYPSLWAASVIAELCEGGSIDLSECLEEVGRRAWEHGAELERTAPAVMKPSAMFPTNHEKRDSSGDAFLSFAIGRVSLIDGCHRASGPLYQWRICAVISDGGRRLRVAMTDQARECLQQLDGLTAAVPHDARHAQLFLSHIERYAQRDWETLRSVLLIALADAPNRSDLVSRLHTGNAGWSRSEASSYAAGYVARAREWGLLKPQLEEGRYMITSLGRDIATKGITG